MEVLGVRNKITVLPMGSATRCCKNILPSPRGATGVAPLGLQPGQIDESIAEEAMEDVPQPLAIQMRKTMC